MYRAFSALGLWVFGPMVALRFTMGLIMFCPCRAGLGALLKRQGVVSVVLP